MRGNLGCFVVLLATCVARAETVAYWRFSEAGEEEAIVDASSRGNGLRRLSGAARRVAGLIGAVPKADALSEKPNAHARTFEKARFVCENPLARYAKDASFTLEGFFRTEPAEGLRMLAGTRSDTRFQGWVLWLSGRPELGSKLGLYIEGTSKKETFGLRSAQPVDDGKVHHFAFVWDHEAGEHGRASLYIDGLLHDEDDLTFPPGYNGKFMVGGRDAPGHEACWAGTVDEMRLSATALSSAEFLVSPSKEGRPMALRPRAPLAEVARPSSRPSGAPKYSDVCFSSRWFHPSNDKDPHDTFRTAKAFGATRFDWVYTLDPKFIGRAKAMGMGFHTALNTILTDGPGLRTREKGRILNLEGERVAAPWMVAWNGYWGCANSPDYRRTFIEHARRCIDAGADGFQVDDPGLNVSAIAWGGCYCEHCRAGFRAFLKQRLPAGQLAKLGIDDIEHFDYKACALERGKRVPGQIKGLYRLFQVEAVTKYYADMRAAVDAHAGRRVPFSSNNYGGRWGFPCDLFDYGVAELPHRAAEPATLHQRFADARRRGKAQAFTFVSRDVAATRRVIATCYACGGHLIIPWDVYMGTGKPRYFGKPEEYADLYQFVRNHAALFDGYEDAAATGKGIRDRRYRRHVPVSVDGGGEAYAFTRAKPGDLGAPVVVHLLDWSEKPEPFRVTLRDARFFVGRAIRARLLRPREKPQDLAGVVAEEGLTHLAIPALSPWGMLEVTAH